VNAGQFRDQQSMKADEEKKHPQTHYDGFGMQQSPVASNPYELYQGGNNTKSYL
jgi:hypothetical protein